MKRIIRTTACIIASMTLLTACKKDSNKSKTELLTSSNWKIVSAMSKEGSGTWTEQIGSYEACELDNIIKFNTNNTVVTDEGATKCDPTDDQSYSYSWSFGASEAKLIIDGDSYDVEDLSGETLIITTTESYNGTTYYSKQTLKH